MRSQQEPKALYSWLFHKCICSKVLKHLCEESIVHNHSGHTSEQVLDRGFVFMATCNYILCFYQPTKCCWWSAHVLILGVITKLKLLFRQSTDKITIKFVSKHLVSERLKLNNIKLVTADANVFFWVKDNLWAVLSGERNVEVSATVLCFVWLWLFGVSFCVNVSFFLCLYQGLWLWNIPLILFSRARNS